MITPQHVQMCDSTLYPYSLPIASICNFCCAQYHCSVLNCQLLLLLCPQPSTLIVALSSTLNSQLSPLHLVKESQKQPHLTLLTSTITSTSPHLLSVSGHLTALSPQFTRARSKQLTLIITQTSPSHLLIPPTHHLTSPLECQQSPHHPLTSIHKS